MSHWGKLFAQNVFQILIFIITPPVPSTSLQRYEYGGDYILTKVNFIPIGNNNPVSLVPLHRGARETGYNTNRKGINNYIGPLNIDIISIIYGSILGDGHAEKIKGGKGTRILIQQEYSNISYLYYLHNIISNLGYCNSNIPKIKLRLGKKGKIKYYLKFNTWTYESFNYIYNEWYIQNNSGNIKIIPKSLELYLTPLALAIWIIDDGCKFNKGLKLATNCFKYNEVLYLIILLDKKYNIKASIKKSNNLQFIIYIWVESIPLLAKIVSPYIIPSIKYKLNNYLN